MKLIIGGRAQGKLAFAKSHFNILDEDIIDVSMCDSLLESVNEHFKKKATSCDNYCNTLVLDNFEGWYKKMLFEKADIDSVITRLLELENNILIICDEVGNGIVPIDPIERSYRERLGDTLILIAKHSDEVYQVTCQIGIKIK